MSFVLAWLLAAGCTRAVVPMPADASLGDSADGDGRASDGEGGAESSIPPGGSTTCDVPLAGSEPFAATVAGGAPYTLEREAGRTQWVSRTFDVFFPHGRSAGADAMLTRFVSYPHAGRAVDGLRIGDDDLSWAVSEVNTHELV